MNRVTKEIAKKLKDAGYRESVSAFYLSEIQYEEHYQKAYLCDYNGEIPIKISAPTISEAIEFTDSKGVYVVPMRNVNTGRWMAEIQIDRQHGYVYENMPISYPTRFAAYLAGLSAACDFLTKRNKK